MEYSKNFAFTATRNATEHGTSWSITYKTTNQIIGYIRGDNFDTKIASIPINKFSELHDFFLELKNRS